MKVATYDHYGVQEDWYHEPWGSEEEMRFSARIEIGGDVSYSPDFKTITDLARHRGMWNFKEFSLYDEYLVGEIQCYFENYCGYLVRPEISRDPSIISFKIDAKRTEECNQAAEDHERYWSENQP